MTGGGKGSMRPHSMVDTSALRPHYSMGELNPTPSALVAQMFWTAVSLLESDFEAEFSMALRLISKVWICICICSCVWSGARVCVCVYSVPAQT